MSKTIRVTVEVIDDDGEPMASCQRDECSYCGWARQTRTFGIASGVDVTGFVESYARESAESLLGLNAATKAKGYPGW